MYKFITMSNFVMDLNDCEVCVINSTYGSKRDEELAKLFAAAPDLLTALQKYEDAFGDMFAQCCSNPITDAWGRPVNMLKLNEAHYLAGNVIKELKK